MSKPHSAGPVECTKINTRSFKICSRVLVDLPLKVVTKILDSPMGPAPSPVPSALLWSNFLLDPATNLICEPYNEQTLSFLFIERALGNV